MFDVLDMTIRQISISSGAVSTLAGNTISMTAVQDGVGTVAAFPFSPSPGSSIAMSPDGRIFAFCRRYGTIRRVNVTDRTGASRILLNTCATVFTRFTVRLFLACAQCSLLLALVFRTTISWTELVQMRTLAERAVRASPRRATSCILSISTTTRCAGCN